MISKETPTLIVKLTILGSGELVIGRGSSGHIMNTHYFFKILKTKCIVWMNSETSTIIKMHGIILRGTGVRAEHYLSYSEHGTVNNSLNSSLVLGI